MQLRKNNARIAAIAGSLLGGLSNAHAQTGPAGQAKWKYDITAFNYSESDGRVSDNSVKFQATRTTEREQILSFGLSYDSLTGASAGGYVDRGGSGQPRLTAIEDQRIAANASLTQPFGADSRLTLGGSFSNEDDYLHTGLNVALGKDFNDKNTTLNIGYAHSADTIDGVVGNPNPRSFTDSIAGSIGEQDKSVDDLIIGFTQVLSKNAIAQINYSLSNSSGYLNDPYKVVSVVNSRGEPVRYIYESRPSDRTAHGIYAALNYKVEGGVLKPSYRFFTDDWGIQSHTMELKYAHELGNDRVIEPRVRIYTQTRADFYRGQIGDAETPSRYLSSDYRLDEFRAITLGLQYRFHDSSQREWRVGFDYYTQTPGNNPDQFGWQNDLNPGLPRLSPDLEWNFSLLLLTDWKLTMSKNKYLLNRSIASCATALLLGGCGGDGSSNSGAAGSSPAAQTIKGPVAVIEPVPNSNPGSPAPAKPAPKPESKPAPSKPAPAPSPPPPTTSPS